MPTLPFLEYYVEQAPEARGVYCLYDRGMLIKIGQAVGAGVSIRSCLRNHLMGQEGACTQKATHFTWKITACPSTTEEELLKAHKARCGQLPRCNDQAPSSVTAFQPAPSASDIPVGKERRHQRRPD
jgi:hypothetical protein